MTKATDVRAHLATGLFLCLIGCLAVVPLAQAPAEAWFTLTKIGPNVWAAMDNPSFTQRAYANAGLVIGDDGVVVVDTLTGPDASGRLAQKIRALTNLPVRFV